MTKLEKKGARPKSSVNKTATKMKPGNKSFKSKTGKFVNKGKKGKDFGKDKKGKDFGKDKKGKDFGKDKKGKDASKKQNSFTADDDDSHIMEIDQSFGILDDDDAEPKVSVKKTKKGEKGANFKKSAKVGAEKETKKKPKTGENVENEKKPAEAESADETKTGVKRKRTDDGEGGSKPKKAKFAGGKGKLTSGKPKLTKKEQKEKEKKRKMEKKNYELGSKAKNLWEELRRFDLTAERRQKVCSELHDLVKGQVHLLIFAHDTSRVVQSLIKYGSKEHRDAIFEEIKGHLVDMIQSKYAKFFIKKILKYGKKEHREFVFKQLSGQYKKLLRHKEAGQLVEIVYNDFANVSQRRAITEEFYGKSFRMLKTEEVKTIEDVIKADPSKREFLLSSLKQTLATLVSKSQLEYSLVHHLFLEYFTNSDDAMRTDMIETAREGFVHMIHTKDGSRVAMTGLWHGTAKDRKLIVKSFKTFVAKICKEEHGHLVMLALFDVVDDTKLVQKAILDELIASLDDVAGNEYGRKVLHYLLAPRDSHQFHPDIVSILKRGDGNAHSKKDTETRRQELGQYMSEPLLKWVVSNCQNIKGDNALVVLASEIIKHATSDPSAAMKAVAEMVCEPFTPNSEFHLVDHAAGHMMLKHLIKDDTARVKEGKTVLFSNILAEIVTKENVKSWLTCNRGCFILVCLFETEISGVVSCLKELLSDAEKILKKQTFAGAQILLKKMSN